MTLILSEATDNQIDNNVYNLHKNRYKEENTMLGTNPKIDHKKKSQTYKMEKSTQTYEKQLVAITEEETITEGKYDKQTALKENFRNLISKKEILLELRNEALEIQEGILEKQEDLLNIREKTLVSINEIIEIQDKIMTLQDGDIKKKALEEIEREKRRKAEMGNKIDKFMEKGGAIRKQNNIEQL